MTPLSSMTPDAKQIALAEALSGALEARDVETALMARGLWYKYCDVLHGFGDGIDHTAFMHASTEHRTNAALLALNLATP